MTTIGIVSDDLTGATTVGALLARAGEEPTVLFDYEAIREVATGEESTLIASTDSRSQDKTVATVRVANTTQALKDFGAQYFSKRIDTTSRGGIGPEVESMLSVLGDDYVAVMVPAMPGSRRIVVDGYSLIDSLLLSETDVAHDIRTPIQESHLPTLYSEQFESKVDHVKIRFVMAGPAAIAAELQRLRDGGARAFVVDAISESDVQNIAKALVSLDWKVLSVDPGPLTTHLAVERGVIVNNNTDERVLRDTPSDAEEGTVAVIAGSASAVTHQQMNALEKEPGTQVFTADVLNLLDQPEIFEKEVQKVKGEVQAALAGEEPLRVALIAFDTVLSGERTAKEDLERVSGLTGTAISDELTVRFGALVRRVLEEAFPAGQLTGAYLTGGDIMFNTCKALEAHGLQMVDYVIPQIDQARIVGGPFNGLAVVCKGGLTGTERTAIQSVNRLFDERVRTND